MKKIFVILLGIITVFGVGCKNIDFGDTNKNVNGPQDANTAAMLSAAMMRYATSTGRPYLITPSLYVQWFQQNVYTSEMNYAEAPGYWGRYYIQTLSNLQEIINLCKSDAATTDPQIYTNGAVENQIAVAEIMKAVIFKRVTDLFGDVPYSEFYKEGVNAPKYDKQEDIYKSLIELVKAARDTINTSLPGPSGDVIYGGDMSNWGAFANSLLLELSLQLSKKYPNEGDYAANAFNEALSNSYGVIETLDQEAWFTYDPTDGYNNPWNWLRPADYGVAKETIDALKGDDDNYITSNTTFDERLFFIVSDTSNAGIPYGANDGDGSPLNTDFYAAGTDMPLMTASYTYLNRAEAAAMGWTTEDAATLLHDGITASYASMSAHFTPSGNVGDGEAYATQRVADAASAGILKVIREEKWIALFPQGFKAWSEWRRTGVPALKPSPNAINDGQIPRRYNYPAEEASINATNYNEAVSHLVPPQDKNTSKIWWDQD